MSAASRVRQRLRELRRPGLAWLPVTLVLSALASVALRQDASWDLQNYHFYNAWAFVHDRLGFDLAPAQLQTYHSPYLDLPFYAMVAADLPPRVIAMLMAVPTGIAWYFFARIVAHALRDCPAEFRTAAIWTAIAIGVTAPMSVSLIGLTTNDWFTAAFVLAALWLCVRNLDGGGPSSAEALAAGALVGAGAGLKLTGALYVPGLVLAALLIESPWRRRVMRAALVAGAAGVAFAATAGPWMVELYTRFGNPLFPYFNQVFRSEWADPESFSPSGYGPRSVLEWLAFPFILLWKLERYVAEPEFRDARPAVLYVLIIVALALAALRRWGARSATVTASVAVSPEVRFIAIYCVVSFAGWAVVYRIYRYLVPLELLAGLLIVLLLIRLVPAGRVRIAFVGVLALVLLTAKFPTWWRERFGDTFLAVAMPAVRPDALVLLVSDEPMAYVLPSFPAGTRFAGLVSNINWPGKRNRLQRSIAEAIRDHRGPLYSLAAPAGRHVGVDALAKMQLEQSSCALIHTNLRVTPLELCALARVR